MAFTGNYTPASFKRELLEGIHNFRAAGHTFKMALYTNTASFNDSTTAYTATNEVSGGAWPAGGYTLTNTSPVITSGVAVATWANISVASGAITARGALIYNSSAAGNPVVAVIDFGGDKTSTTTFAIQFPTADATNAIVRIS